MGGMGAAEKCEEQHGEGADVMTTGRTEDAEQEKKQGKLRGRK